jgi:pimeloyl-ACP methyl ester carboxylesterase
MPPAELARLRTLKVWEARVGAAHTIPRELRAVEQYTFEPARFAALRTPSLLLLGGASPPWFAAGIETLRAGLPDARVAVLEGQQHVAIDTAPALVVREVLGFLTP